MDREIYNILVISPISIAGSLIIKGLGKGFQNLSHNVAFFDVRELDETFIKEFNPDFVVGYDYVHFINPNAEKIISELNIPVLHYFADDPNANFAHSGDLGLYEKLSNSSGIVFCWDKGYLSSFKNEGFYLPLGIDPDLYSIIPNSNDKSNIIFAGRPLTLRRQEILCEIVKKFPGKLNIYSYKKHFDTSVEEIQRLKLLNDEFLEIYKSSYKGFLETENDLARVYADSAIVLNITMEQGISSMNYRVLEVLAAGGFLLTDFKDDTAQYFNSGEDLVFYNNCDDLIEKIAYYLRNTSLRTQISLNGKNKVIMKHTFEQRAKDMLDALENNFSHRNFSPNQ